MTRRFQAPAAVRLADESAERVRRSHDERIRELQAVRIAQGAPIKDVELEDGVETPIAHGLGRRAMYSHTAPRGASTVGMITDARDDARFDPDKYVVLKADGYGATVTVDLWVF